MDADSPRLAAGEIGSRRVVEGVDLATTAASGHCDGIGTTRSTRRAHAVTACTGIAGAVGVVALTRERVAGHSGRIGAAIGIHASRVAVLVHTETTGGVAPGAPLTGDARARGIFTDLLGATCGSGGAVDILQALYALTLEAGAPPSAIAAVRRHGTAAHITLHTHEVLTDLPIGARDPRIAFRALAGITIAARQVPLTAASARITTPRVGGANAVGAGGAGLTTTVGTLGQAETLAVEVTAYETVCAFVAIGALVTEGTRLTTDPGGQITDLVRRAGHRWAAQAIVIVRDTLARRLVTEEAIGARFTVSGARRCTKAPLVSNGCASSTLSQLSTLVVSLARATQARRTRCIRRGAVHVTPAAICDRGSGVDHRNDETLVNALCSAAAHAADETVTESRTFGEGATRHGRRVDARPAKATLVKALETQRVGTRRRARHLDPIHGIGALFGGARAQVVEAGPPGPGTVPQALAGHHITGLLETDLTPLASRIVGAGIRRVITRRECQGGDRQEKASASQMAEDWIARHVLLPGDVI